MQNLVPNLKDNNNESFWVRTMKNKPKDDNNLSLRIVGLTSILVAGYFTVDTIKKKH